MILDIQGYSVQIDDADYKKVSQYNWTVSNFGHNLPYVIAKVSGETIYMHRLIADAKPNQVVDHISRDSLDNRRSNLRVVSQRENIANAGEYRNNTSGYRGVIIYRNGYRAQIKYRHNGKPICLTSPTVKNIELAAAIYNDAMVLIHGETVFQNDVVSSEESKATANGMYARLLTKIA